MAKKKEIKLEKLTLSKTLELPSEDVIENIKGKRYDYFEFSREKIQEIASKDIAEINYKDAATLVQALFPNYLICSGLFDSFIMFETRNGIRIDPPKYWYRNLRSYLNNNEELKYNRLIDEMIDLFNQNDIVPHQSWLDFCNMLKEEEK